MRRLLPLDRSLPLFDASRSRAIEATALAASAPRALMERAGLAVAKLAQALQPSGSIWIVCGPGNNGGDGQVAARRLRERGWTVHVSTPLTGPFSPAPDVGLVIDALLGLGLKRAPEGALAACIAAVNALQVPVLAVDLPSGLLADSGALAGPCIRATHTLALLSLKPGLFTGEGRAQCGELWFDDLGVAPDAEPSGQLLGHERLREFLRAPGANAHKGSQGDVLVIGGAPGMQGAAGLAASAALAAGAGRVYLDLLAPATSLPRPELMLWPSAQAPGSHTIVCGCGGGGEISSRLPAAIQGAARLVLDADALNAIAADPGLADAVRARRQPTVLTPHPLEAARLLGLSTAEVQADRLGAARALAATFDCTVILKGSGSLIAAPGRITAINSSGSPALATPGSGDVLAGWCGGWWARHPATPAFDLACAAVHWHGLAGDSQARGPLRASDLIERMHALDQRLA
jgi:hydroxyethylthiazole kinase-like uncharacterized protein yjeF